jgi:hypothetical protein
MHFLPRASPDGKPIERVGWLWRKPIPRHHCGTNREQFREPIVAKDKVDRIVSPRPLSRLPLAGLD